jgi:MFS family permease
VTGVQSAIALEALVSAAFILIGSKVGDLMGRKRAYVLGLLGYAVGALAMTADPGRDRPHQHRRATARPSGRAAGADPRQPRRAGQLVPHDAPARPQAVGLGGGMALG